MTADHAGPVLLISPHLDDAVLSMGATIAALTEAGTRVIIGTVFAGKPKSPFSPVAEAFHADCGFDCDGMEVRREEDMAALAVVGAEGVHLDFLDAIYRRMADDWLCRHPHAMFDSAPPAEPALQGVVAEAIGQLTYTLAPQQIWTCAAIGGHVDHRLTRAAVTAAARVVGLMPAYWEDLPYGFDHQPVCHGTLPPPAPVRVEHLHTKLAAISCYNSQLRMLWPAVDWRCLILKQAAARWSGGFELRWPSSSSEDGRR
jgi:LmbE family N-acetylglucosaminyl deacetylase